MRFWSISTQSVTPSGRPTNSAIVRRLYPSRVMAHPRQGAWLERFRAPAEVDRALGQQTVIVLHHAGGKSILADVVVAPEIGKQSANLAPRVTAEQIRQLRRAPGIRVTLGRQGARMAQRGRHREELHHDIHAAEEEPLLALHPRLIGHDAVEALASELATAAVDEANVRRQPAKLVIAEWRGQSLEPERRIPAHVEARDPRK